MRPASPHLVILQSGAGHALLCLHLVVWKMGAGQRQQVVSGSTGRLLARGVPVGRDGREGWGLLQRRRRGKHALEIYRWGDGRKDEKLPSKTATLLIRWKKILT